MTKALTDEELIGAYEWALTNEDVDFLAASYIGVCAAIGVPLEMDDEKYEWVRARLFSLRNKIARQILSDKLSLESGLKP